MTAFWEEEPGFYEVACGWSWKRPISSTPLFDATMIVDFETSDELAKLQADICIVGSGAVGIAIAKEFEHSKYSVLVLESGGFSAEKQTQELYRTENRGLTHNNFGGRIRILGGTTTLWAAQASPFDDIDFAKRSWVPFSGWPISRKTLEPYFARTEDVFQVKHIHYDHRDWPGPKPPPEFDSSSLRFVYSQFSPEANFAKLYRTFLTRAHNVRVLLHANVVDLKLHPNGGRLESIDFKTLAGKSGRVSAKYFIVCCGGIETARLLLASNSVEHHGIGNRYDVVGRFFQDHIHMRAAQIRPKDRKEFLNVFGSIYAGKVRLCPKFASSETFQKHMGTLNIAGDICFEPDLDSPIRTAKSLVRFAKRGGLNEFPGGLLPAIVRTIKGAPELSLAAYKYFVLKHVVVDQRGPVYLGIQAEPEPNPDSRVYLSEETDRLGMPRTVVDWQLSDLVRKTIEMFIETVANEFKRLAGC